LERELGEAVKVVLGLQSHQAADFVVAALYDVARKANLVRAAVAVAKNVNGSETSEEWKRSADKTMKGISREMAGEHVVASVEASTRANVPVLGKRSELTPTANSDS
jgi:hypothetical protein